MIDANVDHRAGMICFPLRKESCSQSWIIQNSVHEVHQAFSRTLRTQHSRIDSVTGIDEITNSDHRVVAEIFADAWKVQRGGYTDLCKLVSVAYAGIQQYMRRHHAPGGDDDLFGSTDRDHSGA